MDLDDLSTHAMSALPAEKGAYILILQLDAPQRLRIGKLGEFDFAAGTYAYVGSAFGPGGLRGRLKHHLRPLTRPHWHIDYLRQVAPVYAVWYCASEIVYEHAWAEALWSMSAAVPAPGFGASDCRCMTHLIYFEVEPDFEVFRKQAGGPVQRLEARWFGSVR